MRMLKLCRSLDFGEKALGTQCGCKVGMKNLYSNIPVVSQIASEVHGSHTADAYFALNAVAALECRRQAWKNVAHSEAKVTEYEFTVKQKL